MKKILISTVLIAVIAALVYWVYSLFATPINFEQTRQEREKAVIQRLKDIRTAQRAYRSKYNKFAGTFEDLIGFVKNDSLKMEISIGSEDDSVALAQGRVRRYVYNMAVKDTVFPSDFQIEEIRYIPYSVEATGDKKEFEMDTTSIKTESSVQVAVFQAFAPYTTFLGDLDGQELINYRDVRVKTLGKDDGLKVGSLSMTNNEAGNWE